MYRYYLKLFFKKNNPKAFNVSLIFPLITTILCSIITITTYSAMNSLEDKIINKIITVNGYSKIYMEEELFENSKNKQNKIMNFLNKNNNRATLSIEGKGILIYKDYNGHDFFRVLKVIGVNDIQGIQANLDVDLENINDLSGKILIGEELADYINLSKDKNQILSIFAPLDGNFIIPSKSFNSIRENFKFSKVNAIEEIEKNYVFIDYFDAINLFKNTSPHILLNEPLTKKELENIHTIAKVRYEDWENTYPLFFNAIRIEKFLYTSFGFILIFIASFNLYGLINLIIYRKKRQLSILIYKGMDVGDLKKIFVSNILIIGFIGSLLGILIAYLLIKLDALSIFTPMLTDIEISYPFIFLSLVFNLLLLYIGTHLSIKNNIKNIEVLKSNAIKN